MRAIDFGSDLHLYDGPPVLWSIAVVESSKRLPNMAVRMKCKKSSIVLVRVLERMRLLVWHSKCVYRP